VVTLQIEHPVSSYETWKQIFDSDPIDRRGNGVIAHRVYRPVEDPNYIRVDLDFASTAEAESFHEALQGLWSSPRAAPALAGTPQARIMESTERVDY
jgi:hypothetical protein